jgi:hypothetical protein
MKQGGLLSEHPPYRHFPIGHLGVILWALFDQRAAVEKYVTSILNISGHRQHLELAFSLTAVSTL